ncbi:hypothetical protein, partial [Cytobacillus firmus]|uniref:hypothetical protein n=1 Tax=Cytobacillus firmus TaxID=1399 RepID=UPI002162EE9E
PCLNLVQLQTGKQKILEILSEPCPTSDRQTKNPNDPVRTLSNFGQINRKSRRSCLNLIQLRTDKQKIRLILSEPYPTSD